MVKKKTKNILIVAGSILLLLVIAFALKGNIKQEAFSSGTYIQVPTIYYYECNVASSPIDTTPLTIDGGQVTLVGCPGSTDKCDLSIESQETNFFSLSLSRRLIYQICNINTGSCSSEQIVPAGGFFTSTKGKPTVKLTNFQKYNKVIVKYQKGLAGIWSNANGAAYYYSYNPFILWKVSAFSGKNPYTSVQEGCRFPSGTSFVNAITNSKVSLTQSSTSTNTLEPYKTRNFIDQYIPISVENVNFVNYNGQNGYCLNRQIFAISTISTSSGDYKIVDSNFNNLIAPSVECCPNEKQPGMRCNSNFNWEETSGSQCSAFNPCAGANYMPSGVPRELIRYNCVNGNCVAERIQKECTSNSDCIGNSNGNSCDTYNWKCYSMGSGGTVQTNNTNGNVQCKLWQDKVQKSQTSYGINILGIAKFFPKTVQYESCQTSGIVWLGAGVLIIGLTIIVLAKRLPKKRR